MFEVFGPFARPSPSLFPIALALWPLVGIALRRRAAIVVALGALAALGAFVASVDWIQHLGLAARVGQLDLVLALDLDPLAALASFAVASTGALLLSRQKNARRAALTCVAVSAASFCAMADGIALYVLAAAILSFVAGAIGRVRSAHFVADRLADGALVAASAIWFWTLGGSWIARDYVSDLEPRVVVASRAPNAPAVPDDDDDERPRAPTTRRGARATLSLGGLPNASALVDGTWLRDARGGHVETAPFTDAPIAAGPHTVRVHVGAGSDDYFVPRVEAPENERVLLAVRGATTTFREAQNDLVVSDARGEPVARDAIARRRFFGASAASIVLALVAFAFAARARVFPFASSSNEPARALGAIVALVALARFPIAGVASHATEIAIALAVAAAGSAASALRDRDGRALLAAEIAIAGAAMIVAPAFGVLHAVVAAMLFARRAPATGAAHAALLPTRVALIAASPVGLAVPLLVASWLAAGALARLRARERVLRAEIAAAAIAIVACAACALAPRLLASSFRTVSAPSFAVAHGALAFAVVAFAITASRTRALERFAASPPLAWPRASSDFAARAVASIASAISGALVELDERLDTLVALLDRAVRFAGALASVVDRAASSALPNVARIPLPSEIATRAIIAALAVVALGLFVVPWAS